MQFIINICFVNSSFFFQHTGILLYFIVGYFINSYLKNKKINYSKIPWASNAVLLKEAHSIKFNKII